MSVRAGRSAAVRPPTLYRNPPPSGTMSTITGSRLARLPDADCVWRADSRSFSGLVIPALTMKKISRRKITSIMLVRFSSGPRLRVFRPVRRMPVAPPG
jgi:hypothetical protein